MWLTRDLPSISVHTPLSLVSTYLKSLENPASWLEPQEMKIQAHDRLGCCPDQAYKRAALRYHPDKASAEEREEAEKKFKQVNAANVILSDPAKRQRYDAGDFTEMAVWDCLCLSVYSAGHK